MVAMKREKRGKRDASFKNRGLTEPVSDNGSCRSQKKPKQQDEVAVRAFQGGNGGGARGNRPTKKEKNNNLQL